MLTNEASTFDEAGVQRGGHGPVPPVCRIHDGYCDSAQSPGGWNQAPKLVDSESHCSHRCNLLVCTTGTAHSQVAGPRFGSQPIHSNVQDDSRNESQILQGRSGPCRWRVTAPVSVG